MTPATGWTSQAIRFLSESRLDDGWPSCAGGQSTLYGTCYAAMTCHYLSCGQLSQHQLEAMVGCQQEDGWFVGPELRDWSPSPHSAHDREHILLHLLCSAVLPTLGESNTLPRYPLRFAHPYVDLGLLRDWLDRRDLSNPWLEGNNLLFMGQLLLHLRDAEQLPGAGDALSAWFEFLDDTVDPDTGLWGTDRGASEMSAMCGGYHQLLLYYSEQRPVRSAEPIIDIVLSLQDACGGFGPCGGGACEDVDAVDMLVNLYKLTRHRRPAIRSALRRCVRRILRCQNTDGGWSYRPGEPQDHLGIPATRAAKDISCTFPTWFRVHSLALASEVLTDEPGLDFEFGFNSVPSMGWHRRWDRVENRLGRGDGVAEIIVDAERACRTAPSTAVRMARIMKRLVIQHSAQRVAS